MQQHEYFMQRCLSIAANGRGFVAPNPMVGSVLVRDGKIISEGFHQKYGEAHAEVNALKALPSDFDFSNCTLYVNLEPCAHTGKTPPCADLIVTKKIPKVVIGSVDSNPLVGGQGIKKLQAAGIQVVTGVLEKESLDFNRAFFYFHQQKAPYVILKWAESADGFMDFERAKNQTGIQWISKPDSQIINHKWRTEVAAILVGKNTFNTDKPQLTSRLAPGMQPKRMVVCNDATSLNSQHLKLWSDAGNGVVFHTSTENPNCDSIEFINTSEQGFLSTFNNYCFKNGLQSVIIEGGKAVLDQFLKAKAFHEIRVIKGTQFIKNGLKAPQVLGNILSKETLPNGDQIIIFQA